MSMASWAKFTSSEKNFKASRNRWLDETNWQLSGTVEKNIFLS